MNGGRDYFASLPPLYRRGVWSNPVKIRGTLGTPLGLCKNRASKKHGPKERSFTASPRSEC